MARPRMPMGSMGNMGNMMKQAQKMQQDMLKMQEELEQQEFEGTAGGGAVVVTLTGKKELTKVTLKPEIVDPDDVEMLEDLILVAVNEGLKKVDESSQAKLGKLTGGLNIPGLF